MIFSTAFSTGLPIICDEQATVTILFIFHHSQVLLTILEIEIWAIFALLKNSIRYSTSLLPIFGGS